MGHPSDSLRFLSWLTSLSTLYWLLGVVPVATAAEKHQGQHAQDTPVATSGHGMKAGSELSSSSSPAAAGGPEAEVQPPAPPLSLEQLEQMALESNPTLAQAAAQVHAAAGRTLQAGLYPNPTVGYSGEEISTPASGGEHGGFVEQTIITAGKLGLSRSVFQYEQVQTEELAKAQRVRVLTTVRLLYYESLGAQNLVAWRDRLAALAQEAVDITHQLFNVGQADQPDLLQAEIEAQQAQLALVAARADLDRSWRQLATVVGNPTLPHHILTGTLDEALPELDGNQTLATLLEDSPDLKVAKAAVQGSEAALKRARVEWIPDVTLRGGVHYNFERTGPHERTVGPEGFAELRIPFPVFNRNQGNIAAAQADLDRAHQEVQRVEFDLRRRLAAAFAEYSTARQTVETYHTHLLIDAQRAYELYLQRYQQMAAAYPQVLIAQRTLFQAQVAYVMALVDMWRTVIEVQGFFLTDGLAAPTAPSTGARAISGTEVTAAGMFEGRRASGRDRND